MPWAGPQTAIWAVDTFTSVLAIVALLAGQYLGWVWLDPAMGIGHLTVGFQLSDGSRTIAWLTRATKDY